MRKIYKDLLIEDLENKRLYEANWETECDPCGSEILKGDKFVFMGDKQKVCMDCIAQMQNDLEENNT